MRAGLQSLRIYRWLRVLHSTVLVEAGLRTRSLHDLTRSLGISLADGVLGTHRAESPETTAQVRWAVGAADRVIRLWPGRSRCLRRALIAGHLLRAHKPSLHIGGARHEGQLTFHAWLEVDGQIAADAEAPSFRRLVRSRAS